MRSILLHIYEDRELAVRVRVALDLARAFNGHITCLHASPFEDYLSADPLMATVLPAEFSSKMQKRREALKKTVEDELRNEDIPWSWIHMDTLISEALVRHSVLADVIIISRAITDIYKDDARAVAGKVITNSKAAVLAVPPELERFDAKAPVVVAWNGAPEVGVALRQALPLLKCAESVHLVTIGDRVCIYPPDGAARYLSRHGVKCELVVRPTGDSVAGALLDAALEFSAGAIVMGGYGHSRLREFFLGGATREMLETSRVPLLFGH